MALPRFYVPNLHANGEVGLPDDEANHATRVLRAKANDVVILFDGIGHEARGTLIEVSRQRVVARIEEYRNAPRVLPGCMILAVALPKGDRQRTVVEHAVELGVHHLLPIKSSRSVAEPNDSALQRLERYTIEACKQCGRNQLMRILKPQSWSTFSQLDDAGVVKVTKYQSDGESEINQSSSQSSGTVANSSQPNEPLFAHASANGARGHGSSQATPRVIRWLGHPYLLEHDDTVSGKAGQDLESKHVAPDRDAHPTIVIAIGPEGGFDGQEVAEAVNAGWQAVCIADRILRVETAVAAFCTLASQRLSPNIL